MNNKDIRIDSYQTLDAPMSGWTLTMTHLPTGTVRQAAGHDGRPGYRAARERLWEEIAAIVDGPAESKLG